MSHSETSLFQCCQLKVPRGLILEISRKIFEKGTSSSKECSNLNSLKVCNGPNRYLLSIWYKFLAFPLTKQNPEKGGGRRR